MKNRVIEHGAHTLNDHELLEVLLYYCIPRKDTNPIGHKLMNEFGNLNEVIMAEPMDLINKAELSEGAALLLNVMGEITKRISKNRWEKGVMLDSSDKAIEYCEDLIGFERVEVFYMLCLDAKNRVIKACEINRGSAVSVSVEPRTVASLAIRYGAANIMLLHNHPGGEARPTSEDIVLTKNIMNVLAGLDVHVLDHIIISDEGHFSFADNLIFDFIEREV